MPVLEWREAARNDLLAILDYISDDNPDAAQGMVDEIAQKARGLVLHPKLYKTGRVQGTREMVVRTNCIDTPCLACCPAVAARVAGRLNQVATNRQLDFRRTLRVSTAFSTAFHKF